MTSPTLAPVAASNRVERFETIVVGAGQAGLSVAYHLAQRDIDFAILSNESRVGDNWRRRWDSLRLFTPAAYSGLPGMSFPALPSQLPDKDQMADYLERYADRFDLPVRLDTHVDSLAWDGEKYVIRAGESTIEADTVVVATGAFQTPRVPVVAARLSPRIRQLHSSEYLNPLALPEGPALVVGAGNSGAQIAIELAKFRKVWLAGRDTGHLPRRFLRRDLFQWIWPVMNRATADTRLGRRMRENIRSGGDALIGIPERTIRDAGITRVGRLSEERGGQPVCDGTVINPSVIVWCTGFGPNYRWIGLPIFGDDGYPRHVRGVVSQAPGLYFMGLRFQYRLNSSLVGGAQFDAEFIAEQVARHAETAVA